MGWNIRNASWWRIDNITPCLIWNGAYNHGSFLFRTISSGIGGVKFPDQQHTLTKLAEPQTSYTT